MNILDRFRIRIYRERFQPTPFSAIYNPSYIIRRGLFLTIKELAPFILGNVLDFGCGSKPYESIFTETTSYIGVDIEVSGHKHTDSKIDVLYDGKHLPFADGQFDAVVSFEVFEHIFNISEVMAEIHRVTRDAGYLLISIPFAWEEHEIPYDYARYTSYGITHCLESHGYEVVGVRKTTTYFLAISQMAIAYIARVIPKSRYPRYLIQLALIAPFTLSAYVLNSMLPKQYEYFCNCVVLARKSNA